MSTPTPRTPGMSYGHSANNYMDTIANQTPANQGAAVDVSSGPSFGEFLDALADAKGYAMTGTGRAWVVTWPDGHITCETRPVLICRDTKVIEVDSAGRMILA
jgi:hypothetical protein